MHQILLNPGETAKSNRDGIAYVVSRMNWYNALTDHLLLNNKNKTSVTTPSESVQEQLKRKIIDLYKAILFYQMNSVRYYFRNQVVNFLLQLGKFDDFEAARNAVEKAETDFQSDWNLYKEVQASDLRGGLVQSAENMEKQLRAISQTLKELVNLHIDLVALQNEMHIDHKRIECLQDLRLINPQDDMTRIENDKENLFYGAYKWILEDNKYAEFVNWDESKPSRRLLWIKGDAGTGKTMLLIGIIRELSNQSAALAPALSYFFCQSRSRSDLSLNNASAALRSLMWMFLIQQPDLISHLQLSDINVNRVYCLILSQSKDH
jgi:DNA replication protein DnaC